MWFLRGQPCSTLANKVFLAYWKATAWITSLSHSPALQAVWLEPVLEFTFLCGDTEYKFILCLTCKWTGWMEEEELLLELANGERLRCHAQAHVHPRPGQCAEGGRALMLLLVPCVLLSLSCPDPILEISAQFVLQLPCCGYLYLCFLRSQDWVQWRKSVVTANFLLMNCVIFVCSCFLCGCEEGLCRTSASWLLHCRIRQRFHQNVLAFRDLVLGETRELVYKQNVKCGAMETSAIPTRLGMDVVSIGGSCSFLSGF